MHYHIQTLMDKIPANQEELVKLLGVTQASVSRYLKGRPPKPYVIRKLAKLASDHEYAEGFKDFSAALTDIPPSMDEIERDREIGNHHEALMDTYDKWLEVRARIEAGKMPSEEAIHNVNNGFRSLIADIKAMRNRE